MLLNMLFLLWMWLCFFSYCTDYEITRQIDILEAGGEVVNETRAYDIDTRYIVPTFFGYSFTRFPLTLENF